VQLSVYCLYSVWHPDDRCQSNENVLVNSNISYSVLYWWAFSGLLGKIYCLFFMDTHVWKHNFWISSQVVNPQALQVWHIHISYKRFTAGTRQFNFSEWGKKIILFCSNTVLARPQNSALIWEHQNPIICRIGLHLTDQSVFCGLTYTAGSIILYYTPYTVQISVLLCINTHN
jgi:hypothetical protein